ncbi:hypothetical protein HDV06_001276 [Boothiomyces sp. JEL0866]|nr:hypothetical protein HDV06_001276 [Boothiomyces sp. JEL0866]
MIAQEENLTANSVPLHVKDKLPSNFTFGSATAAYQVEGAFDKDGRTPSIWDTFSKIPGKVFDGSNGDVAVDQYHLYPKDIQILKQMGATAYRLSLSWSRIVPEGKAGTPINPLAIQHYNDLFNALLENGIEPWVTLYHWDLPQVLDDEYGGLLNSERLPIDFAYYAEACFREFGDRVKNWMTLNEPHTFCKLGYGYNGPHAPGRTDDRSRSEHGDPSTEVWRVGHTSLLAHGKAVQVYREKYQAQQNGRISIALNSDWFEPLTLDEKDVQAAKRRLEFMLCWFADPIFLTGDYPASLRAQLGDRLPYFTDEEKQLVLGSADFFALNSYTSMYVKDSGLEVPPLNDIDGNNIATEFDLEGNLIGPKAEAFWLFDVAWGFGKLLKFIRDRYGNPEVVITENGFCVAGESEKSLADALHDSPRIHYYHGYLQSLVKAVEEGSNIMGYFAWSLLDNFEWARGYSERFGITYVDYNTLERYPKESLRFIRNFFHVAIKDKHAFVKKTITKTTTATKTTLDGSKNVTTTKTVTTEMKEI